MQDPLGASPFIFLSLNSFVKYKAEHEIISASQYSANPCGHRLIQIRKLHEYEPDDNAEDNGTEKRHKGS